MKPARSPFFAIALYAIVGAQIASPQNGTRLTIDAGTADALIVTSSSNHTWRLGPNSGTGSGFGVYDESAGTTRLRIDLNGNLGIGTVSPQAPLDVAGRIRSSSAGFMFPDGTVQTTAASGGLSGAGAAGQVSFWGGTSTLSGNGQLFWDNTNARLGLGTATPQVRLDVLGAVRATTFQGDGSGMTGITAAPTGSASGNLSGTYPSPIIANSAVTSAKIANGQVVKSLNSLQDAVSVSAGANVTVTTVGNSVQISSTGGATLSSLGVKSGSVSGVNSSDTYFKTNITFSATYPNGGYAIEITAKETSYSGLLYQPNASYTNKTATGFTILLQTANPGTTVSADWMTLPYNN